MEKESGGGGRGDARGTGGVGLEEFGDGICRFESGANTEDEANERAHHLIEEAVALDAEADLRTPLGHLKGIDGADGRGDGAVGVGREGFKVVGADEVLEGAAHGIHIERAHDMSIVEAMGGREDTRVPNIVAVLFAFGIEARMEVGGDLFTAQHADVGRQASMGVECHFEAAFGHAGDEVAVKDLSTGVNAMVGAATAVDINLVGFNNTGEDLFDGLLHADVTGLCLPTIVGGAVVGTNHFKASLLYFHRCAVVYHLCNLIGSVHGVVRVGKAKAFLKGAKVATQEEEPKQQKEEGEKGNGGVEFDDRPGVLSHPVGNEVNHLQ